ncbi:MAG TPA: hypothetical protein VHP36_02460 [Chitinispirillaceae bacterium]|nr:hypothetical protein [Chitinispirillaceae bacterium]
MNILIIIVFCLTGTTIVLGVASWIYLLSISSKISELEQEVNKKAQEFDNFKKEKLSSAQNTTIIPVVDTPIQETTEQVLSNEPIQVMRNVGGSFEKADKHTFKTVSATPLNNGTPEDYPEIRSNTIRSVSPASIQDSILSKDDPKPDNEIMATVDEQPQPASPPPLTILQLYSQSAKDADFNNLWKNISTLLQSNVKFEIGIDFSGINFLYDKELAYLTKIHQIVTSAGSKIHLLNCDNELITILGKSSQLANLILMKDL